MPRPSKEDPLSPELLLRAYRMGFFPMADSKTGGIGWYSPDPRAIIPLETFRIPRSLRKVIREGRFETRFDSDFTQVIRACADRQDTWISGEIIDAYSALHACGHAHSVETWVDSNLVGGLYGVSIGGAFFGESMFSTVSNASKVALVALVDHLCRRGFRLLDTQFVNEHILQFHPVELPREEYLRILTDALAAPASFADMQSP